MVEGKGRDKTLAGAALEAVDFDLETAFREHHGLVFRAAYRVTGNTEDAEDVLQNVFLRLARREAAPRDPASYLYRAAVNAALDLLRSRRGSQVPLEEVEPVLYESRSLSPDSAQAAAELRQWLRDTVARLSPRAAEMFALRFFEDRSNIEIARLIGTSEATVSVTLHRARERVRKEMEGYSGGKP